MASNGNLATYQRKGFSFALISNFNFFVLFVPLEVFFSLVPKTVPKRKVMENRERLVKGYELSVKDVSNI